MGKRVKIPKEKETEVLNRSRRRCCICFGLNGDDSVKKGQIGHLDHDPSNNDLGNLLWLCFDHHDEYDSETSQSKKLTKDEVEIYREELYEYYCTGVQPTPRPAAWGDLRLADDPPIFKPNPKTFASNPQRILGGRVVNIGEGAVSLGAAPEVLTLDSDGQDLGYAKDITAGYRIRKLQERLSSESIATSSIALLLPAYEAFIEIDVWLEPGGEFDSVQLLIPCDPPIKAIGSLYPINVKVEFEWPGIEDRGLYVL